MVGDDDLGRVRSTGLFILVARAIRDEASSRMRRLQRHFSLFIEKAVV